MDDNRIIELYLCRDESAVSETSDKYGIRLRTLAFNIVNDRQTSEECENDTYMQTWKSIPPHEPRGYLYAFLARITRHISLNICRERNSLKRKAFICELSAEMEECIPCPDDTLCRLDDIAFGEAVDGFLSTLTKEKRNIFVRRYWFMDSVSDISKRYSVSQSKVKTTLFRVRNQLKEYLRKEGYAL